MTHQGSPRAGIDEPPPDDAAPRGLLRLACVAAVSGTVVGLVGGAFRLCLGAADILRNMLLDWARVNPAVRWLVPMVLAGVAVSLARLLVRWVPEASGSGVQRVEAHLRGEGPAARLRVLPAKFVGGVLSIGAGMALGREGPTVQMGASIGAEGGRLARLPAHDARTLTVSLAGAGLAVAFNAPLGGSMFVFEEVAHAFRTRLVVTTFVGTTTSLAVARLLVGNRPVFLVSEVPAEAGWHLLAFAALGMLLGVAGVLYNRLVVLLLNAFESVRRIPPEAKAGVIGALVGLLGVAAPGFVGGGDAANQELMSSGVPLGLVAALLVVRWLLGPVSYSAGTPGGLFAPLLLVGAAAGYLLAGMVNLAAGQAVLPTVAFAIVGMSTFFAAVVRAPATGVILIVEMTATTSLLVPMLLAAAFAVITAVALGGQPIYDTLRLRMEHRA